MRGSKMRGSSHSLNSLNDTALALLLETHSRSAVQVLLDEHDSSLEALSKSKRRGVRKLLRRLRDECEARHIRMLVRCSACFPASLRAIPDPPMLIFSNGDREALEQPAVAIVGARAASRYGLEMASGLAAALASRGVTVVSGLALGIDGAAHRGALEAGGRTIAVLGSGLARVQPMAHQGLARRILESGGMLISEYALHRSAAPWHFPERNRIISGLATGVVVVEASRRSGSLITARLALEQGREVMAVPGAPGLPASSGGNRLLKQGAALIETAQDVADALGLHLDALPVDFRDAGLQGPEPVAPEAAEVLVRLGAEPVSVDSLAAVLNMDVRICSVNLTELEVAGFVERVSDGYIRRPRNF